MKKLLLGAWLLLAALVPALGQSGVVAVPGCYILGGTIFCGNSSITPSTPDLTNAHIFVGNAGNVATDVAVSGDATISNAGALTVTKTSGVAFGALATSTDAGLLTGTVASARIAGAYPGITGTGTLTSGATGAGFTLAFGSSTLTGTIPNANIANPQTTVNGQTCTLGSTCTITAAATDIAVGATTVTGGLTTNVLYINAGVLGAYTAAQLTALVNPATSSLPGTLPAFPGTTSTFFRGDGSYATLNCAALTTPCITGNQTITLSGDVTGSGATAITTTIAANAVTYAKFQQVAASSLVGNATGSLANATGITLGSTLAFSGAALQTGAGTGDLSWSANSFVTTLATVNSDTGPFGSSTAIPTITVNGKGLVTAVSTNAVIAPAGTLTGATLAANVLASSLTSVGTLSSLTIGAGSAITSSGPGGALSSGAFAAAGITALTGDVTASGSGSVAATLATAQPAVHTWALAQTFTTSVIIGAGSAITSSGGGGALNTLAFLAAAPAGTLTGTTLAANVVTSSLTSVGTLTGGATGAGFTVALATSTITGALPAANFPALTGDVTTVAGALATTIGATKVTSAMLNADVFSTAHSWSGQQTLSNTLLLASGTVTASTPWISATQTANTTAAVVGIFANLIPGASTPSAASKLLELQYNSADVFSIARSGRITSAQGADFGNGVGVSNGLTVDFWNASSLVGWAYGYIDGLTLSGASGARLGFTNGNSGGTLDVIAARDAAGIWAQRNSTNAQIFRVYNTYTDASNGEWGALDWQTTSNVLTIGTKKNGTGSSRGISFVYGGTSLMDIGVSASSAVTFLGGASVQFAPSAGWVASSGGTSTTGAQTNAAVFGVTIGSASAFGFHATGVGSALDTPVYRDAAGIWAFRNSTTAQTIRVYNTWTDASNGEWGAFDWQGTSNVLSIGTKKNGTGATRNLQFLIGNTNQLDYGVTTASTWTFASQIAVTSMTQTAVAQSGTVCYNSGTGAITYDATVGCLASTLRVKRDWREITPQQALATVVQLRPGSYSYKDGMGLPTGEQIGLAAEQVEGVDDRLVAFDDNGQVRGVRYQQASALYPAAIQALNAKLGTLAADNDNLRAEVEQLKRKVNAR